MRRPFHALAMTFALLALGTATVAADTARLVVGGQERTYLIERPVITGPRPTVVMLHGINGTAEQIAQRTRLAHFGPRDGFVVVFPQSHANAWNRFAAGKETPRALEYFRKSGGPPDDVGFLKMLVADLIQRGISDPARIFLAGLSNGGFLTLYMLCTAADSFAAMGLLVTSMPDDTGSECRPPTPLPVLVLGGTADQVVPYGGGLVSQSTINVWSFEQMTAFLRKVNGCVGEPGRSVVPGIQQRVEIEYAGPCRSGPIVTYKIVGGTHATAPDALNTAQLLLDFFRDKARGQPIALSVRSPLVAKHIMYRRFDGQMLVTGDVKRGPGGDWLETNTRGSKWSFRSTSESNAELVLYDASRDVYVRIDLVARKMFVRKGLTQDWRLLADVVGVQSD